MHYLTTASTPSMECANDPDHTLPAKSLVYDDNAPAWVPLSQLRIVCNEQCADELTDRLIP